MSKVGGALPSWYWPAGIPRRVAVPQQPLSRQLQKALMGLGERPAVWTAGRGWITGAALLERALERAAGLRSVATPGPVAVVDPEPADALGLLIGIWLAGREALLVAPGADAATLGAQMDEAGAEFVLSAGGAGVRAGVEVVNADQLDCSDRTPAKAPKAMETAIFIPSPAGLVVYSHFALSAMATGLAAFIKELKDLAYLCLTPLWTWEALCGVLGALLRSQPVVFAAPANLGGDVPRPDAGMFAIIARADADAAMDGGRTAGVLRDVRYLFVSTGPFTARWRRRFEAFAAKPILPLWGLPEIGPAVVAHPTWYPLESHGFPLVNVSIVPIDPHTGQQSLVPWEMLTLAEIGVESLSAASGYARADAARQDRIGKVVRTRQIANIDHVGVVTLHA